MSNVGHKSAKQRISERIKAAAITNRLQGHVLAEPNDEDYENKQMTQSQVTAARILLAKVVPDLKQTELTGIDGAPITIIKSTMTPQQAAEAYADTINDE